MNTKKSIPTEADEFSTIPLTTTALKNHCPTSILSVDKFRLCLCLVFRPFEISPLFFFSPTVRRGGQKNPSRNEVGYNLFYSRAARNSAKDGWTPIYSYLGVINANGLVKVTEVLPNPLRLARPWTNVYFHPRFYLLLK